MTRHSLSLRQQNTLRLALVFVLFEILAALTVVYLLMLPMARLAASDLAGMIVLSTKTWSELPPETRFAFEQELASAHGLFLTADKPTDHTSRMRRGGPYIRQLESELSRRAGVAITLSNLQRAGQTWHLVGIPGGERTLWIVFSHDRVGPQPLAAGLMTMTIGLVLAALAAWWLARRTVAPLERFDAAAAQLGRGETPELLPETGPRELAALARRFNKLVSQVRNLLDARTTLLAGLSHDLRTPLARMRLALEMQERRPDPAWIARLDHDVEEMNQLVGELLNLARGLGQEATTTTDVAELLRQLAESTRETGADIELNTEPIQLELAAATLRRVLGNLLDNARRYAGNSRIELRLEVSHDNCRIGVLDRGPGIPEDQLEAVFRPFHRVESSRSSATGGTGLGLAIVRQLTQANGWLVWLNNRPQGGLAAWVELPSRPSG